MKFMDEYRDARLADRVLRLIARTAVHPWTIMEVCGGQTHAIVRFGLDQLLPRHLTIVHGPGCPVCVTPVELVDKAVMIAMKENVIFCSFGDMLRVPGTHLDLFAAKAKGADVRVVYSPADALRIARENPMREVVFFAVGFETTAPANAMVVYQAKREAVKNFTVLVSHVLVPPALEAILSSPKRRVQGLLAAGHVCTVMGTAEYEPIASRYQVPIVVTGFEPLDILQGIFLCVRQLEKGKALVENAYSRCVQPQGNRFARQLIREVYEAVPRKWRGVGRIEHSGLALRQEYEELDAEKRFELSSYEAEESTACISGLVLQGFKKPPECPAFGTDCSPERPLGATMVSSEGACAAYYRYRRFSENGTNGEAVKRSAE